MEYILILALSCAVELNFDFTTGTFLKKDSTEELRVFYEIPTNELTHIRLNQSGFFSKYEIICTLNRNGKEIGDIWMEKNPYDSSKKQISGTLKISAPPGEYEFKITVKDQNSQKTGEKKDKININKISNPYLAFSSRRFAKDKKLFFEVYNFCKSPFKILYKSMDSSNICDSIIINDSNFINEIAIELDSLHFGTHEIYLALCTPNICNSLIDTIYIKEPFWIKDWETKVKQLYYIAKDKEIDSLLNTLVTDREKNWIDFWEKKKLFYNNDNVETEYFKRVDYANAHFTYGRQGWETDRGKVYILFGEPDEIENHPFEIDMKPYEIWYYYSKKIKYSRFIFQDKDGFGDYILTDPLFFEAKFLPEK